MRPRSAANTTSSRKRSSRSRPTSGASLDPTWAITARMADIMSRVGLQRPCVGAGRILNVRFVIVLGACEFRHCGGSVRTAGCRPGGLGGHSPRASVDDAAGLGGGRPPTGTVLSDDDARVPQMLYVGARRRRAAGDARGTRRRGGAPLHRHGVHPQNGDPRRTDVRAHGPAGRRRACGAGHGQAGQTCSRGTARGRSVDEGRRHPDLWRVGIRAGLAGVPSASDGPGRGRRGRSLLDLDPRAGGRGRNQFPRHIDGAGAR